VHSGYITTLNWTNVLYRYRVEAEVRYEGHKAKFLFWDRECTDLIGKTASELQAIMLEVYIL
jgi:hypothetical protein